MTLENNKVIVLGRLIPDSGKIHQNQEILDGGGYCMTIKASIYKDPIKIIQLGNIAEEKDFSNPQCGRIYDIEGIAPTLNTCGGATRAKGDCI